MPLTPGTRLGPYEIIAPLGAGGMGEVYRARDTRLGRDVAVKVLPEHLASAPEVRARFEREAKTISSLNHPHICTLFDVGHEGDVDYLVMELVEGSTLADRLEKGPLALDQMLKLGSEIADALDRAHRAGVVHRDLKPANVMLTKSGAKLMDFGLARAAGLDGSGSGSSVTMATLSRSPTMSHPLTAAGTIVGTFLYMAPEQLEGGEADARSDIWALGCVLYEMATGQRAFGGKSQASLISSIMTAEPPPISAAAPMTPPALERLVRACLAKDPNDRIQTAHDVKLQLEWTRDGGSQAGAPAPATPRQKSREPLAWAAAAVAAAVAGASIFALLARPKIGDPVTATISPAAGTTLTPYSYAVTISPDGHTVAFAAVDSVGWSLWVRPLESETPRALPDTRDINIGSFWSPDGRSLGYFTGNGKLRKVGLDGGSPVTVCDARHGRGGTWNRDGVIVFSPAPEGPLLRVSAGGGEATPVTALDDSRHETSHRFPFFLPDGDHFLYVALPPGPGGWDTYVGSLKSKTVKKILTAGSAAIYAEPGYLLFARDGHVMAQRFDAGRLSLAGDAVAIGNAPEYSDMDAEPVASVSTNGRMVVLRSASPPTQLRWIDRAGADLGTVAVPPGPWSVSRISPDARRAAVFSGTDLLLVDLERAMPSRFASTASTEQSMVWSPDGTRIAYTSKQTGQAELYVGRVGGGGEPEMVPTNDAAFKLVHDWSPDGRSILFGAIGDSSGWDLWILPMEGDRAPVPYLVERAGALHARISPNGRWAVYQSFESGDGELYVQSFPQPGHKARVTSAGGDFPSWTRGGTEMIFAGPGQIMAVSVDEVGGELRLGVPRPLFTPPGGATGGDVTPDGERFLVSAAAEAPRRDIRLVLDWAARLAP